MRPDKQNINFVNKEVVNYSAIANKAKSLSDGIRSIDFDRINDSIVFNSSLVHNRPKIHIKPSNNSINNVSEMNFNDNSTLTGITSDSSNTDPTKAISSAIMIDVNNRIEKLETKTQNQSATQNETTFTGNVTADTFNGYHLGYNNRFYTIPAIPVIGPDLVMEVGRYIDFHYNGATGTDKTSRLYISKPGTLYYDHSFIVAGGDIKARNCIADNGNLNDIASRTKSIETKNTEQDNRLDSLESKDIAQDERLGSIEAMDTAQNETINNINTKNDEQDTRLTNIETKNTEQDGRLDELEVSKLTVVHYSTNASINVVCLDGLDDYIYRPRFKVSIIFEDSEYYPTFTSENTLLASYLVKLKIINNNTLYTLKKNIYSREVDGKVEISGSNMIILNWDIQKGRIDINLTDDGSQPVIILGIEDQNYYPNALIQYPVVDNYLVSKNLAHDNEERLTTATTKNTEQDARLDTLETTTIPSITTDISNLKQADTVLHEESVRYYDYSREHIEEIENTKIPNINTKNNEQDTRIQSLESNQITLTMIKNEHFNYHISGTASFANNIFTFVFDEQPTTGTINFVGDFFDGIEARPADFTIFFSNGAYSKMEIVYWNGILTNLFQGEYVSSTLTFKLFGDNGNQVLNYFDESTLSITMPNEKVITRTQDTKSLNILTSDLNDNNVYSASKLLDSIYPVGSIYLSLTKSPPSLGGTWELISGGYFLQSTTTSPGETGGSSTHTHTTSGHVLTAGEMPRHKHTFDGHKITGTVSDIMLYDGGGMKKENPTGCFSWTKYGSQTWQGQSSSNAGLKISFTATPAGSISAEGKNQAHNHGNTGEASNIPPYITCFMYKRTA